MPQKRYLDPLQTRLRKYWKIWSAVRVSFLGLGALETNSYGAVTYGWMNVHFASSAKQLVDLDDFVEMTKNYAQGIVPSSSETGKPDGTEVKNK